MLVSDIATKENHTMKRVTNVTEIKSLLSEIGTTCYLCGQANLHYLISVPENVDQSHPDRVVILCKDCSARRRKRPVHAYVSQRFSEVAAEYARLAVLLGKLPTQFEGVRETPNTPAVDLGSLVGNWDGDEPDVSPAMSDTELSELSADDPRITFSSGMFDEELYERWLVL